MPNVSQLHSLEQWKKWYQSGAVPQKTYAPDTLIISAVVTHFGGPAASHQTLSLGDVIINSGPDWSVHEPLCAIIVPTSKRHKLKIVLKRIPGNAVPVKLFFPS